MANKPTVIALEEHYLDPEVKQFGGPGAGPEIVRRLDDLGALRLKEMDEAGIDFQVLSHSIPGLQSVDAATGVPLARRVNDRLHEAVQRHPDRFAAFAALPTADPRAAADELERTITRLGFKGAMINGMTAGVFHDDERFWPIYERAQALDVPIYIHPALPHPSVIEAYYKDYVQKHPGILRAAWGFTVETATQGIRFVLSGVFDAYPGLKIIPRPFGRGTPILSLAHQPRVSCGRAALQPRRQNLPRHFLRAFLDHDEWLLFRPGPVVLRNGNGHRSDSVLGRLPVRGKSARHRVDKDAAAVRRRQEEIAERQRQAPAEAIADRWSGLTRSGIARRPPA